MKKMLWLLLASPSLLMARDFNGRWVACMVSTGGNGLGRCTVDFSIRQTDTTFVVSDRTYRCNGTDITFRPFTLDLGPEVTTADGKERSFLEYGEKVGSFETNGRYGRITRTPDQSNISELRFDPFHAQNIIWSECFKLSSGKAECIYGSLNPRSP